MSSLKKLNLLLLLIGTCCMHTQLSAQVDYKNEIRVATQGSKENLSIELQYVREIQSHIAVLATLGYQNLKTEFDDFECSRLQNDGLKLGIGAEWRMLGDAKGPFLQGNILFRNKTNNFKIRIPDDPNAPIDIFCSPSLFSLFGIDIGDLYSLTEKTSSLGFSGKIGYRLKWLKERMTFSPYATFESSDFENKDVLLESNVSGIEAIAVNPHESVKGIRLKVGVEVGVRF